MERVLPFLDRLSGRGNIDVGSLFKSWSDLRPDVQQHLQLVYITLSAAVLAAAFGAWMDMLFYWGGVMSYLGTIGGVWWLSTSHGSSVAKRGLALLFIGFCQGLSLGSLITPVFYFAPDILFTAFLGTSAIFACFSGAAILSRRRSFLYLGAVLASLTSVVFTMRFASMFVGGYGGAMAGAELFVGLAIFTGYVLVDTQSIIERAHAGDKDHIRHAMDLFINFAAIFARLLALLLRNAQNTNKQRRQQEQRRQLYRYAHRK